jgi:hypothetical protein
MGLPLDAQNRVLGANALILAIDSTVSEVGGLNVQDLQQIINKLAVNAEANQVSTLLQGFKLGSILEGAGITNRDQMLKTFEDIKKGLLRGHPKVSLDAMFSSDPLRMIRLIRFQLKYDWQIPGDVLEAVKRNAERINIVSGERIMGELKKVTEYGKLEKAVRFMESTGLLHHILPEVEELKKISGLGMNELMRTK